MTNSDLTQPLFAKLSFTVLALTCAGLAIFAAILMTEPGQLLNLNRDWIINYYRYKWLYAALDLALFFGVMYLGLKYRIWRPVYLILAGVGVSLSLYAANALLDHFFPTKHKNAVYISIEQANSLLANDEIVYAVEIGGEAVAYPRRFMEIPHVAGKNIGGKNIAMTFCALSNLPVVYDTRMNDQETDLGILLQTHNNLVLYDDNSGELIQQITGETEFGAPEMETYANQMMSWKSFKSIYPKGEVFEYKFDRWLDGALLAVFADGMKQQFDPDRGPLFPTLRLDDTRLPLKEQVWGLNINGDRVAFARSFFDKHASYNTTVGSLPIVLSYNTEFDTLGVFRRDADIEVTEVDVYGNSSGGKLARVPSYNGVFWMVWSHFFPDTRVMQ